MAENKDYLKQEQESGCINISEDVLASIAAVSAMEVDGVASLASGLNFGELFSAKKSKTASKGVKIVVNETDVAVDVYLAIKYGFVIPNVSAKVQDKVITAIDSMTGLHASSVNVHISGVAFEKEVAKVEPESEEK